MVCSQENSSTLAAWLFRTYVLLLPLKETSHLTYKLQMPQLYSLPLILITKVVPTSCVSTVVLGIRQIYWQTKPEHSVDWIILRVESLPVMLVESKPGENLKRLCKETGGLCTCQRRRRKQEGCCAEAQQQPCCLNGLQQPWVVSKAAHFGLYTAIWV